MWVNQLAHTGVVLLSGPCEGQEELELKHTIIVTVNKKKSTTKSV